MVLVGGLRFINKNGEIVIHPIYWRVRKFKNNFSQVNEKNKWGIIDKNGKKIIPSIYEMINDFSEGFAAVKLNNKWGFVDEEGSQIIPCIFEQVNSFKNKYAAIRLNNKWGFINYKGEIIIDFRFEEVGQFNEFGFANIMEDGYIHRGNIIDVKGNIKIKKDYHCFFQYNNIWENRFIISYNGKYGCLSDTGKVIIPFIWDNLKIEGSDFVSAFQGLDIVKYINKEGKQYWTD